MDIQVSGDVFILLIKFFTDAFVQEQLVEKILKMVSAVEFNENLMKINLNFDQSLLKIYNQKPLLLSFRDDLALFGDVKTISFYYQSLDAFAAQQPSKSSIDNFIKYVFDLAKTRTSISDEFLAEIENQAAITALVIYFGADRFELLVGDVIIRDHEKLVIRNRLRSSVTLQGRPDLQKHFIYSMALQLFSTHGASDAIGEYKEFLDTNKGGSGFSFADLLADRAGTRLAMIVTKSKEHAIKAQNILSKISDESLLPSINGLEEGLNEEDFVKIYKNINSKRYQQTLLEIDNRLKTLIFYQIGW